MRFVDVLSVLSKSSPYAVSTERKDSISAELDAVKKYLYIETDIQKDFEKHLTTLSAGDKKVIFLCGSSGDGKSEILTQYASKFSHKATFHLDATHSFEPDESAISTLDKVFSDYEGGDKALVVGINVGMMGNYVEEGGNENVCDAIANYLDSKTSTSEYVFLNFEDYPKFNLTSSGHSSDFVKAILQRITKGDDNIIRQYFDREKASHDSNKVLCTNYQLLSIPQVQDRIVDVLFKARLIKDQFLTARTLLDFVHTLLSPEFTFYLSSEFGIHQSKNSHSYLRLFYLLGEAELANNYHKDFLEDFDEPLLDKYAKVWNLHTHFVGDKQEKKELKAFYKETIFSAIHTYINRNAKSIAKGKFLISSHNGYQIMTEVDMEPDFTAIQHAPPTSTSYFVANISVEGKSVSMPVNINLLNMMNRIIGGYRPNKHDKNTIVILDDFADHIAEIASSKDKLTIVRDGLTINLRNDDDEIEVSGV